MSSSVLDNSLSLSAAPASWTERVLQFGWMTILVGALAMVATYPARSQGLGMVTKPMLKDLDLNNPEGHVVNGALNFWGTLIGSLFCLPIGWLFGRCDRRWILAFNLILLGCSVMWMSTVETTGQLFAALILTRGLGQSALSVVSITIVARSFDSRRLGIAMGCYAIVATPFYMVLIWGVGKALTEFEFSWRTVWCGLGAALVLQAATAFLIRRFPDVERPKQGPAVGSESGSVTSAGSTLWQALASPAFWVFSLTVSFWGMISSGVSIYNVHILNELQFKDELYFEVSRLTLGVALASNLLFGWLTNYVRLTHLLALCLLSTAAALTMLPFATETWHVYAYGVIMGIGSGAVALIFFAAWGKMYGRRDLGRIQGIAQMLTVFASAAGPFVVATSFRATGSYTAFFHIMAAIVFVMAILAAFTPQPRFQEPTEQPS